MPKSKEMNKYRVSLPLKVGKYVACVSPEAAVQACFPDAEIEEHSKGPRWVRYKTSEELPKGWPKKTEGGGGGTIIDLEEIGNVLVVFDE